MKNKRKIHVYIQARQTSKRLPNKIFLKLNNITVLENIYQRMRKSKFIDKIIFVIPSNKKNLKLKNFLIEKKYHFFSGPEKNVLSRYFQASKKLKTDVIVRITADCPLIDFRLMDTMINKFLKNKKIDYLSNTLIRSFPDGLDVEIFSRKALKISYENTKKKFDLEHVTPFMKRQLNVLNHKNEKDYSVLRWTLDTIKDYNKLKKMFLKNSIKTKTSWKKILNYENS